MVTPAQLLVQRRSVLLRDLAGVRSQLRRIRREVLALSSLHGHKVEFLDITAAQCLNLDVLCRKEWGYKPIETCSAADAAILKLPPTEKP